MKEDNRLLKIGEVARLNRISTDTLRYYDKIGLFRPQFVEPNGYRCYTARQLLDLDLILWLKMNGASLNEIQVIMDEKSLDLVVPVLEKENERIRRRIARMEDQYYANRFYISQMEKCLQLGTDTCYFLEFPERYLTHSEHPIDPALRGDYEMSLKEILGRQDSEETYLNSFFGGIFPRLSGTDFFERKFYPMVANIRNKREKQSEIIPAGIYGVMQTHGGFDRAYASLHRLLEYLTREGFRPAGDCFVFKIWECWESDATPGEILELQIPVIKK